jgi:hypothetical protein
VTKLTKLKTEEKRIVRGATPEEELKAKQLSDEAHAERNGTKQLRVCKNQFHHKDTKDTKTRLSTGGNRANRGKTLGND